MVLGVAERVGAADVASSLVQTRVAAVVAEAGLTEAAVSAGLGRGWGGGG